MAEGTWSWAWFLAGGVAAFALTVPPIVQYEGATGQDIDQTVFPVAAVLTLVGLAFAWRRPALCAALAGASLLLGFFALLLAELILPAGLLLLGATAWVLLRAPAAVRLLLGVLFVWAAALVVASLVASGTASAPLSGLALAAMGLAYPVLWALRERTRWARHTAWAAALAWSALCLAIALLDVVSVGDGLAVVSSLLLAGATAAVAWSWRKASIGPAVPGPSGST